MLPSPEISTIPIFNSENSEELLVSMIRVPLLPDYLPVKLNQSQEQIVDGLWKNERLQMDVFYKLNNNSKLYSLNPNVFGDTQARPLSAYYYLMEKEVVVETGLVNGNGIAALHENLLSAKEHDWMRNTSLLRYSGHVWYLPDLNSTVALFENQENTKEWDRGMINIVNTLTADGFVCVGANGAPLYEQPTIVPFVSIETREGA